MVKAVKAQKWLDQNYPNKKTAEIYINEKLEGELDLSGFTNLERIYISHHSEENKLKIKDEEEYKNKIIRLVNAQSYLESKYNTLEDKAREEKLDLSNQDLEGELNLEEFISLEEVNIAGNPYLKKEIKKLNPEATVIRWDNVQEWFDKKYSNNKEKEIEINFATLDVDSKELKFNQSRELKIEGFNNLKEIKKDDRDFLKVTAITIANCPELEKININSFKDSGKLILENVPKLDYLDCNSNKLSELDVSNCPKLTELYCHNNLLIDIVLPRETENLEVLALLNNDFERKDLSFLEKYSKLERLYLGNFTDHEWDYLKKRDEEKDKKKLNQFIGSLESLKNLESLKVLDVSNTDISNNNANYFWQESSPLNLPKSLEEIYCSTKVRPESKVNKLESKLKDNKNFINLNNRYIKKRSAQDWLDENYPESGCKIETKKKTLDGSEDLSWNNKGKKREKIKKLDIREWGLIGKLDLSKFKELEELDCSHNLLTELTLTGLENLRILNCSNNELKSLKYHELSKNPMTSLNVGNNKFTEQKLTPFSRLTELEKLYVGSNKKGKESQFRGSLKHLKNLTNLKELDISGTNISSGLEYLPKKFQKLYCDSKNKGDSIKFVQVFSKYSTSDEGNGEYYDISEWMKDKKNLLLRSDEIQKDIRRVFDRRREEDIKQLEDPKKLLKDGNQLDNLKWAGRIASMCGGVLSLTVYPKIGGVIAVGYPFFEAFVIEKKENEYTDKKEKWDEFSKDTKRLWNHYRELVDVFEPFEVYKLDENDQKLKILWEKFNKKIMKDGNIIKTKEEFDKDLKGKWKERKWQWKGIEAKLVEITGKVAESEGSNNQQSTINSKEKAKEADKYETRIEIPTNYGSINK